ncbi:Mannitol dehydrogenase domain protein [Kribbella flavida DSM 17836]|uniref:Mannitol dehydrogenase domain protein n=1 Tax=Kribbella flavida (strain DSM 17836 / JCM 10339 / NBRC 14399) TaxID=479435 RepID=D2PZ27_KRIFD|nr:mannitol dehydrogenase family protein [Kribbella flavida]ADB31821.1 Mannitol dehydrogenase domain protein [Kribbella flavida DSM 17836]
MNRLSLTNLPTKPAVEPGGLSVGIVHLGIGAFHRAHQAVFTERAAQLTGDSRWGISGVTQRSAAVRDQLAPQDGLYSVLTRGGGAASIEVIGSVREVLAASEDPAAVVQRIADPRVGVVTLTVTEKGYRARSGGGLDLTDPEIQADLTGRPPRTVVGQLAAGLARRSGAPLTVLSCDNLVANGPYLARLVREYAEAAGLAGEQFEAAAFPASMVDRIVPATTDADRDEAARLLGVRDEAVVVAEPFIQWVIEDAFAAEQPAWDAAGAVLTADVAPWEQAKLRMLNATHSMLAYLGALRGYETIAEAVRDEDLATAATELMRVDVVPTLTPPDGLDLTAYGESVLERFANPALKHRTAQVAMDGSVKLPVRLLGTVQDRLAAGAEPYAAALAVAAWMVYVSRTAGLDDPQAARLQSAAASAGGPAALVDALLAVDTVFAPNLRENKTFRSLLVDHVTALTR